MNGPIFSRVLARPYARVPFALELNAERVVRCATHALPILATLVNELRASGREVTWRGGEEAVCHARRLLALAQVLSPAHAVRS